jgi:paraquat-inducible protein B
MRQPKQALVGGFILGALVLAAAAMVFFGRAHLFEKTSLIVVYFGDSVAGLTVGAPVTFHGVQIGSVERIAIQFSADTLKARIPVYLELSSDAITWQVANSTPDRPTTLVWCRQDCELNWRSKA